VELLAARLSAAGTSRSAGAHATGTRSASDG
jgi:hypothetical protein